MTKGQLIKHQNLIKWILETKSCNLDTRINSDLFVIKDCKCYFSIRYACLATILKIELTEYQKLNSSIEVIILVTSNSKMFPPERHTITGECKEVKLWSSYDRNDIENSLMTFDMIINASKDDICLQTASYITNSVRSLVEDFSKLLETGTDHDIEMKCGENTIKTHKLILSTRSDVFRAMLQSDMSEARTGVIEIQEMDGSYFREFTRYLYTDEMHDLTLEKAKALYEAGDKYNIRSLVLRCAEYLEDILCPENSFEIYTLADAHSDEKLKDVVKKCILEEEVYRHEEHWMAFYKCFPDVALEIYRLSYKKKALD